MSSILNSKMHSFELKYVIESSINVVSNRNVYLCALSIVKLHVYTPCAKSLKRAMYSEKSLSNSRALCNVLKQ